jgi:hypothetical protein
MNENWQKGIKDLQNIVLSKEEKSKIKQRVLLRSPYASVNLPIFVFIKRYATTLATILLMAMTGGVAFASEKALPGNILYPVKIKITEPVRDLIKISPVAKIEWQAEKANRRLKEAEALSQQNKLDEVRVVEIENLFAENVKEFKQSSEKEIAKIEQQYKEKNIEKKERVEVSFDINKVEQKKKEVENVEKLEKTAKKSTNFEREIRQIEKNKAKAQKEMEDRLEQLEKAKEQTLKNIKKNRKSD